MSEWQRDPLDPTLRAGKPGTWYDRYVYRRYGL